MNRKIYASDQWKLMSEIFEVFFMTTLIAMWVETETALKFQIEKSNRKMKNY